MNCLKELREEAKVSASVLAREIGVTERYICFIEKGDRTPSLKKAEAIATFFGKTIDEIFLPKNCTPSTVQCLHKK